GSREAKPLRQVKFRTTSTNFPLKGGSYVTTTPALQAATLHDFLYGDETVANPKPPPPSHGSHGHPHAHRSSRPSAASLGLAPSSSTAEAELAKQTVNMPLRVLYPTLQTAS